MKEEPIVTHEEPLAVQYRAAISDLTDQEVINEIKQILIRSYSSPKERVEIIEGILRLLKYEETLSGSLKDLDIEGIKEIRKMDLSKFSRALTEEDMQRIYGNTPEMNECRASDRAKKDSKSALTRFRQAGIL